MNPDRSSAARPTLADRHSLAHPRRQVRAGGQGARPDRIFDHLLRGGAAQGDGGDGSDRRAEADRRLRDADRILVQPRRVVTLFGSRLGVRGSGGGNRHAALRASDDDDHVHDDK